MHTRFLFQAASFRCVSIFILLLSVSLCAGAAYPNDINDEEDELLLGTPQTGAATTWYVSEPYINLWIISNPLSYRTSFGDQLGVSMAYKQRNARSNTHCFGFGPGWESAWLSYVQYSITGTNTTVGKMYAALGGSRTYFPDGTTRELRSNSKMTRLFNGGSFIGWEIDYSTGGRAVYTYLLSISASENYAFLAQTVDPTGKTNTFNYDTINGVVRLRTVVDYDGKTNQVRYDSVFTNAISKIDSPYGYSAGIGYDSLGRPTSITNAIGLIDTFAYNSQGLITNLQTSVGSTAFRTETNAFGPNNLGGTNQVNRLIEVTSPDLSAELFIYRDQSTKLSPGSSIDLLPASYSSGYIPDTSPYTNTFDNSTWDARNSFHWGKSQYAAISTNYLATKVITNLTLGDYRLAMLKHWLGGYSNNNVVTPILSSQRAPSPDGGNEGLQTWYDYSGKASLSPTNWGSLGTNRQPLFSAYVLPNGGTRFIQTDRNEWEKITARIDSITSTNGSTALRTNLFAYSADGLDVITHRGPSNELLLSNALNSFHQIVTNFGPNGSLTVNSYDSAHRLLSSRSGGLTITNLYYASGSHVGWLQSAITVELQATNSFTYTNGLPLTITSPNGTVFTNTYDALARSLTIQANAYSMAATNIYDGFNLAASTTASQTNAYYYDSVGRLQAAVDPRGYTNGIAYCECGSVIATTNAVGGETHYSYDLNGNNTVEVAPDGASTQYVYDSAGRLFRYIDESGVAITNYYNNQGSIITASNVFGQIVSNKYDLQDRVVEQIDANGVKTGVAYDDAGRTKSITLADGGTMLFGYSTQGLIAVTNQIGDVEAYGYDVAGRLTAQTNANHEVTRLFYDSSGNLTALVDGNNRTNQWQYDAFNRVTNRINASGVSVTRFSYDVTGALTNRWTPAKGNTGYTYDAVGNLTHVHYQSNPDISLTYDEMNRVSQMQDGLGTTRYTYDSAGRLLTEDGPWSTDTIVYTYYPNGLRRTMSIEQPNGSPWVVTYSYDAAHRLTNVVSPSGSFSLSFTNVGGALTPGNLLRAIGLPNGGHITNDYDLRGRLTTTAILSSSDAVLNSNSYDYNLANERSRKTRYTGSYVDYGYDSVGRLRSAFGKEGNGSNRLHEQLSYGYDSVGNLRFRTNNSLIQTFAVDSLNRLSSVSSTGALTVAGFVSTTPTFVTVNGVSADIYSDNTFARANVTLSNGPNTYVAVAQDSLGRSASITVALYIPATANLSYDDNGNLIADGRRTFTWTEENRIASVIVTNVATSASTKTEFQYDGFNRCRVEKHYRFQGGWILLSEERLIYDGNSLIQVRDSLNLASMNITRGLDITGSSSAASGIGSILAISDRINGNQYVQCDAQGSIITIMQPSQSVERFDLDPFGRPMTRETYFGINEKPCSSAEGVTDFLHRHYDSNLQRWISEDPFQMNSPYAVRNLYSFVDNDPVSGIDPLGEVATFTIKRTMITPYIGTKKQLIVEVEGHLNIDFCCADIWPDRDQNAMVAEATRIWNSAGLYYFPATGGKFERIGVGIHFDVTTAHGGHENSAGWNSVTAYPRKVWESAGINANFVAQVVPSANRNHDYLLVVTDNLAPNGTDAYLVFDHEFGHFLGEEDHYRRNQSGFYIGPQSGWAFNIMGQINSKKTDSRNIQEILKAHPDLFKKIQTLSIIASRGP